jgi:hypothetical protein
VQFSRQRIGVNSASSKRTSEIRFEILRQFATMLREYSFKLSLQTGYIWPQSWSKNANFDGKIFFVTSALSRAPELQNAKIKVHFSRLRIEVDSASSKRTSDKRFEILRKFFLEHYQFDFTQNAKLDWKIFFCKTCVCFVEKKIQIVLARILVAWFSQ